MRSRHHFPVSLGVGAALAATVPTPLSPPALAAAAGLLGTAVDLDHFLIARARTGSWEPLRRCLADPRIALLDQAEIFDEGDVGTVTRLGSHLAITAAVVTALATVARSLALTAAAVLAAHIACDVAWDLWRWRTGAA
jgi:hypothetical protein